MTRTNNIYYVADPSCFIVRKSDNYIMGTYMYLGEEDSIDNYKDKRYTDKTYKAFYDSISIKRTELNLNLFKNKK